MKQKFLLTLLLLISFIANAYDFEVNGIYYNVSGDEAIVIYDNSYVDCSGSLIIPETVTYDNVTYSVTAIGERAFINCYRITGVTIPNSVCYIGDMAFAGCDGLTSVTIPSSVIYIGNQAFSLGDGPSSIIVENGNPVYDSRENCNAIIETQSNRLIAGCRKTIIPNSVTAIGDYAFCDCDGLANIYIPNSVTSIGDKAFYTCDGLRSITIPNSIISSGSCVFSSCSNLRSIIVESDNPIYDSRNNCNAVIETSSNTLIEGCRNTIIPNSVTMIGDNAFYECYYLANVSIPNSVTSIGKMHSMNAVL